MKAEQLPDILQQHDRWLRTNGIEGRRAVLNGADLRLRDLSEANLTSALLAGANLERADLRGAKLANADLQDAKLSYANLDKATLAGANLSRAEGRGMSCFETDFSRATLRQTSLDHCIFYASTLSGSDARRAVIRNSEFFKAELGNANFSGAVMPQTDLSNCKTENTNFSAVDWRGERIDSHNPEIVLLETLQAVGRKLNVAQTTFFAVAGAGTLFLSILGLWAVWSAGIGRSPGPVSSSGYMSGFAVTLISAFFGLMASLARLQIIQKIYHFQKKGAIPHSTPAP